MLAATVAASHAGVVFQSNSLIDSGPAPASYCSPCGTASPFQVLDRFDLDDAVRISGFSVVLLSTATVGGGFTPGVPGTLAFAVYDRNGDGSVGAQLFSESFAHTALTQEQRTYQRTLKLVSADLSGDVALAAGDYYASFYSPNPSEQVGVTAFATPGARGYIQRGGLFGAGELRPDLTAGFRLHGEVLQAVPAPPTAGLVAAGLFGMLAVARRARRAVDRVSRRGPGFAGPAGGRLPRG